VTDELDEQIETNAQAPRTFAQDGTSATQQPLPDQIAADRYLANKRAHARNSTGLRFFKARPPGAC
jgi:hypothetical protein